MNDQSLKFKIDLNKDNSTDHSDENYSTPSQKKT